MILVDGLNTKKPCKNFRFFFFCFLMFGGHWMSGGGSLGAVLSDVGSKLSCLGVFWR